MYDIFLSVCYILAGFLLIALMIVIIFSVVFEFDDYYSVTVYHLDGTVEEFDSVERPTTKKAFELKDGTYYDLPDGVKFKYEIVK